MRNRKQHAKNAELSLSARLVSITAMVAINGIIPMMLFLQQNVIAAARCADSRGRLVVVFAISASFHIVSNALANLRRTKTAEKCSVLTAPLFPLVSQTHPVL